MGDKELPLSEEGTVWESIYSDGKALNRYPFDSVVQFVYRNYSRLKPRTETKILEIGCGAGNNLWFAAREGFRVTGVDGSPSAIAYARKRFADEGLDGDLRVADFIQLPFEEVTFDFVIDRAALTCSCFTDARRTIAEIWRVLIPGGKFFFTPYSDRHSSFVSGRPGKDGLTVDISAGTLKGIGPITFYSKREVLGMFLQGWKVVELRHIELTEELESEVLVHAEWLAVAQKV